MVTKILKRADIYQILGKNTSNDKKGTYSVTFNYAYALILYSIIFGT